MICKVERLNAFIPSSEATGNRRAVQFVKRRQVGGISAGHRSYRTR